jgi:hypothetical protein
MHYLGTVLEPTYVETHVRMPDLKVKDKKQKMREPTSSRSSEFSLSPLAWNWRLLLIAACLMPQPWLELSSYLLLLWHQIGAMRFLSQDMLMLRITSLDPTSLAPRLLSYSLQAHVSPHRKLHVLLTTTPDTSNPKYR